jgi:hypothetical protein
MPTPAQNAQLRNASFGYLASRAAAVVPTVAQSPQTIYTITGRILLSLLLGEITTVLDATVYTLKVTHDPTVGPAVDLSAALTMTSFTAGDYVTLGATVGAALTSNNGAIGSVVAPAPKLVLADGILTLTGSATQTGAMKWSLYYVPLDANSNVVAA